MAFFFFFLENISLLRVCPHRREKGCVFHSQRTIPLSATPTETCQEAPGQGKMGKLLGGDGGEVESQTYKFSSPFGKSFTHKYLNSFPPMFDY